MSVIMDPTGLAEGTYTGFLTISDPTGTAASRVVAISLHIATPQGSGRRRAYEAGYCGSVGLDLLLPLGLLWLYRRRSKHYARADTRP
ncbi:MAG: hypothetical protein HYY16_03295 [Planctomycetes bacterium]|nr:hypothetical protein [Planctomycetota bacterium]